MENDDDVCFWILSDENGLGTRKREQRIDKYSSTLFVLYTKKYINIYMKNQPQQ